ncbi:TetR/AcrR family transcriptional regulator [Actinokineospora sp.]|uniref:TetR/AcrR family transcriptional regulator n=1 Tax=Actinokineospora sp. TaxID=1872133 RepID=UPI003D6ACA43
MATGTRDRIMDVALKLFEQNGTVATAVTAIEAGAGLSPGSGSFYRHFKDKNELLLAVVEREVERVRKNPAVQVSQVDGPISETLARQLYEDLDFLRELKPLIAILIWERDRAPDMAARVQQLMVDRGVELGIADLFLQTPAAPVTEDPAAGAIVMMSAMIGYFLTVEYFGSTPGGVDAERFTATLAKLLTTPPE